MYIYMYICIHYVNTHVYTDMCSVHMPTPSCKHKKSNARASEEVSETIRSSRSVHGEETSSAEAALLGCC